MNEREQTLLRAATDRLRVFGKELIDEGWRPALVVFGPDEPDGDFARIPGYKIALVVPLDSAPSEPGGEAKAAHEQADGGEA